VTALLQSVSNNSSSSNNNNNNMHKFNKTPTLYVVQKLSHPEISNVILMYNYEQF